MKRDEGENGGGYGGGLEGVRRMTVERARWGRANRKWALGVVVL